MVSKLKWTGIGVVQISLMVALYCQQSVTAQGGFDIIYSTANMDENNAPFGFRPGPPTQNNSCQDVREIPQNLRYAANIKPYGLANFYQKYTEAYGIPVVGSSQVSDNSLRRACYTLRFLLADHSQVRKWFYYMSGRVAVIGKDEKTNDIPEYNHMPDKTNKRARGLGGVPTTPCSTAGEENIACMRKDRYWPEDILLHETAHAVHLLGAAFAIPGFNDKLDALYNRAKAIGLWNNTYAFENPSEMLAEAIQSFFNVNDYRETPSGIHGPISTREKLRKYDPGLYNLIKELFPCESNYLKRCESDRYQENTQQLRMNCDLFGSGGKSDDNGHVECEDIESILNCWPWANSGECYNNPGYMHAHCKKTCKICDVSHMEDETGMGNYRGPCVDQDSACNTWAGNGECQKNPSYMMSSCKKSCNAC